MSLFNRRGYNKALSSSEARVYTGYRNEIVKDLDNDILILHDGIKQGGYPLNPNTPLTLKEAEQLFSPKGSGERYRRLSGISNDVDYNYYFGWWRGATTSAEKVLISGGLNGYMFQRRSSEEVWGTYSLPDGFNVEEGIGLFIDWTPTANKSGNVRFGIEFTISKPGVEITNSSSELIYIDYDVDKSEKDGHIVTQLAPSDFIKSDKLGVGSVVGVRFFRYDRDQYKGDVIVMNAGLIYLGE